MKLGPVEPLVVEFPRNDFSGEIGTALNALVDKGTIRIIDLVFITRTAAGVVRSRELTEAESKELVVWDPLVDDALGLLSQEDIQAYGESLAPGSSAALLLFENTWATELRDAVVRAEGNLVQIERVP